MRTQNPETTEPPTGMESTLCSARARAAAEGNAFLGSEKGTQDAHPFACWPMLRVRRKQSEIIMDYCTSSALFLSVLFFLLLVLLPLLLGERRIVPCAREGLLVPGANSKATAK